MYYNLHTKNRVVVQLVSDLFVALSEHEYLLGYRGLNVYLRIPLNALRLSTHLFCNIY
jgi:hypothetical protein